MRSQVLLVCSLVPLLVLRASAEVSAQSAVDTLVQLVGFPSLSLLVQIVRFVKRINYILNPATYRARSRRELALDDDLAELGATAEPLDAREVEQYLVREFGERACVFERVCAQHAARAQARPRAPLDWPDVFSQYKRSPAQAKELYLLSVFLGDIVGSVPLCHQLGKRRSCDPDLLGGAEPVQAQRPYY